MQSNQKLVFPKAAFTLLACGAFWASGIYLGKITLVGAIFDLSLRAAAFTILGLLMVWGALAKS
jgi:hypothetical protein